MTIPYKIGKVYYNYTDEIFIKIIDIDKTLVWYKEQEYEGIISTNIDMSKVEKFYKENICEEINPIAELLYL